MYVQREYVTCGSSVKLMKVSSRSNATCFMSAAARSFYLFLPSVTNKLTQAAGYFNLHSASKAGGRNASIVSVVV
jgi:hypothetical protein